MADWKIIFCLSILFLGHGNAIVETYRTGYHFQPPKNWMNDPNGPMIYKGIYHLFYQYNPLGPDWGNIIWAHSTSKDLINWTPQKPAIFPTQEADINGCWSGSATILPGGKPAILYTGINPENQQVQNLATPRNLSDVNLSEWVKSSLNPLMTPFPGSKIDPSLFRDPSTAWKGPDGLWRVIVGNGINRRGKAILYRSRDFVKWTKAQHPLHSARDTGMWECPDFYSVSTRLENATLEKHILKVSLTGTHDAYATGNYNTSRDVFIPDGDFRLRYDYGKFYFRLRYDYGKFYASKTFYDSERGRRILWGWVNESLSSEDYIAQGWSGVQAIPREIWLDKSGKQMMQWPVPEVEKLRGKKAGFANKLLKSGSTLEIIGITPAQADVDVLFSVPKSQLKEADNLDKNWTDPRLLCSQMDASKKGSLGPFGLKVLASKGMQEYTAIFLRIFKVQQNKYTVLMCSDQSRSSLNPKPDKTPYGVFLNVDPLQGHLPLRVLVDNSIVESFGAKGEACITSRVYPTKALGEYAGLYLFNNGVVNISVSSLSAWSMKKALLDLKS